MRHQSRLRLVRRKTDDQPPLASTDVDTLFDTLDLDNDGRVFLTEVVTSLSATVDTDIDAMTQTADGIFNDTVRQVPPAAGMQISAPISPPPHETVGRAAALNAVASPQASRNFQAADVDNDGVLTRHEFAFFLYPFLGPVFRERHAIAFIERLDNNTDGLVSAEEFVACALQVKGDGGDRNSVQGHDFRAEQEEWSREFREEFDRNQDGVLNLGEVQALLSPEHTAHGIAEGYKLVLQADTNGDHELSRDELTTAYSAFKDSTLLSFGAHAAADAEALLQGLADGIIQHISRVRDEL
jgi:Ca2+-binding EF-hand superfamily protein